MQRVLVILWFNIMEEKQFHHFAETLMREIECFVDLYNEKSDIDIDYERQGNVMVITLLNRDKIIINIQEPLYQIWMATHQQGYHFSYDDGHWYCRRSQQDFMAVLEKALTHQA